MYAYAGSTHSIRVWPAADEPYLTAVVLGRQAVPATAWSCMSGIGRVHVGHGRIGCIQRGRRNNLSSVVALGVETVWIRAPVCWSARRARNGLLSLRWTVARARFPVVPTLPVFVIHGLGLQ